MSRLQRVLIILVFVLVTVLLGLLIYSAFFGPQLSELGNRGAGGAGTTPPSGGTGPAQPIGGGGRLPGGEPAPVSSPSLTLPQPTPAAAVASGGLTQVVPTLEASAQYPTLDRDGVSLLYYNANDGKFYRVKPDGTSQALNDRIFHSVQQVTWSSDRQRAVLEYPDGANIVYDFTTGKQVTLPAHWEKFAFAPDGSQIIAKSIGLEQDNRWLVVSDAGGGRMRPVAPLGANADSVIPNWSPNGQMVALQVATQGANRQEVFFIGLHNEQFPSTFVPGWGFEGQWTPSGNQLLYSVYSNRNGNKPELWMVDASPSSVGTNRQAIGLQTWSHKCAFSGATVAYCAVPNTLSDAAGLFPNELDNGADSLYRVDLGSGVTSLVATPDASHSMRSLLVSRDGKTLYYTARQDGKVYRIQLK